MCYVAGGGVGDTGQIVRHLRWALRNYLIEGSRTGWCVQGRMVGVAWTEHGFFVVEDGRWYWVGRYQAVAVAVAVALRRGEAAAATHWHDFGSSSAVVHESESGSLVCFFFSVLSVPFLFCFIGVSFLFCFIFCLFCFFFSVLFFCPFFFFFPV